MRYLKISLVIVVSMLTACCATSRAEGVPSTASMISQNDWSTGTDGDWGLSSALREPCCGTIDFPGSGFFGETELVFLRYHRADGNRTGNYSVVPVVDTDDVDFDYQAAPRLTLGYRFPSGLGFRARYFDYDADAPAVFFDTVQASMNVDTYTIDMELFDTFRIGKKWSIELSGGVRYNEYKETMENFLPVAPIRENIFRGFGGVLGAEAQRSFGDFTSFYLRGRGSILTGDKEVNNGLDGQPAEAVILTDTMNSVTEIGAGLRYTRKVFNGHMLLNLSAGYEWQLWQNYSSAFSTITSTPNFVATAPSFGGPADVGLHGFVLGAGLSF